MRSGIPWRLPAKQSACELEGAAIAEQTDLHVCDHLCGQLLACAARRGSARRLTVVTLSLFAQPGEESLAIATSTTGGR
jgi:hypothetical protein